MNNSTPVPALQVDDARVIKSSDLFHNVRKVCIEHAGQHYLLRLTRENKLILTK